MRKVILWPLAELAMLPGTLAAQTNAPQVTAPDPAPSQSNPVPASVEPGMTQGLGGDWGGVRRDLYRHGVDLQIGYGNQTATNLSGGDSRSLTTIGQAYFGAGLDLDRIAGVDGGKFQLTITKRHGVNLTAKTNLGLYEQVQEATGRGNVFRLTQASYEQTLLNGGLTMKLGRLPAGNDFAAFGCDFMNLSFCNAPQGTMPYGFTYFYDGPVSTWAAVARANVGGRERRGYLQVGAYQTNPRTTDPTNGFRLDFAGGTGVLVPVEAAFLPDLGADRPGSYKVGAWYETSRTNDSVYDANGKPIAGTGLAGRSLRGRYGFHVQIEQQVTPSPEGLGRRGLSVFLNLTQFDRLTTLVDNQVAAGATWTGLGRRPNDQIAFAAARTQTNPRYAAVDRLVAGPGAIELGSEYVLELDYRFVPTNGLKFSPNIQWGISPGGRSDRRNVVALGMKTSISF